MGAAPSTWLGDIAIANPRGGLTFQFGARRGALGFSEWRQEPWPVGNRDMAGNTGPGPRLWGHDNVERLADRRLGKGGGGRGGGGGGNRIRREEDDEQRFRRMMAETFGEALREAASIRSVSIERRRRAAEEGDMEFAVEVYHKLRFDFPVVLDEMKSLIRPPPVPGREDSAVVSNAATHTSVERNKKAIEDDPVGAVAGPSCEASTTVAKSGKKTQTSIRKWAENTAQKRMDLQWGRALCRSRVPFNFARQDETKALHDLYMELGAQKAKTQMTSFETMRTTVLDALYDEVKLTMQPIMDKMDISGCTLITDGCTDRKFRPVLNFIAVGDGGAVLVKVVDMSGRKKNATALAKLWEEVIREIGVHKVNAICTDNVGVNKRAAKILRRRKDLDIAKIPWLPCAAHTLSLLLKDISSLEWVLPIRKQAKTMVKFIKNHHRTVSLYSKSSMDDNKTLILPTEVRFVSVYQMLLRVSDRQ
ncbi:hypothetical protein CBR_g52681 [Chara braunii]|uniref:DUF659 domain-containing protein n=1 Tax=Chara braunii TaxID=69332 RepID=A0A388MAR2_CHABU|nr:hypothetical protein CBR_g52681 [Chara braunii]|eukprot:GBG91646.1 hypothetical protein CBR_g52681 [Chara braunii]